MKHLGPDARGRASAGSALRSSISFRRIPAKLRARVLPAYVSKSALTTAQTKISGGNYFARCKIANDRKGIPIMIKLKFISQLALTLAAGCLSVGMLGVDASAQPARALITVIVGDNLTFENMSLGGAAKLLVSGVCGVDERDATEILELAAMNNQKIVAICPRTGAIFHIIP
jgi:hypothetical protein